MAHRGNRVACPENTLAAFQRAVDEGADILETDVHLSRDGVFVCIHDATVDRTTNGTGLVADMTYAELRKLSACYGRPEFKNEYLPTLADVAKLLPKGTALALELKTDAFLSLSTARALVKELAQLGVRERTVVLSFSNARLQSLRTVADDIPIGWITLSTHYPISGVDLSGPFWPLLALNPYYTQRAHQQGQVVAPLDPTPEPRLRYYLTLGVDAVLSDDPGLTRKTLNSLL